MNRGRTAVRYAGDDFVEDTAFAPKEFKSQPLDYAEVARFIADGGIIGWGRGRWESGPRRGATGRSWPRRSARKPLTG
ncbi:hypothetical protein [Streptomyces mirabilis]|uniref:hypothetical protein n=1 Tax=Streptomyces mirabilis TaxID=68239 RepID=UPI00332EAED4